GRNVAALDAFIGELGAIGWLRPAREDRRTRAAGMVAEHYAALGHYGPIRAGKSRIVHDLDEVQPLITSLFSVASREGIEARATAHAAAASAVDRRLRSPLKATIARIVAGIVIPKAWRAAWEHVAAAHVGSAVAFFRAAEDSVLLDDLSAELLEQIAKAL